MNLSQEVHPIPKPTKTRKSRNKEFTQTTKQAVRERSNGICEVCKQRRAVHFHHAVYRSQASVEEARNIRNCLHVCEICHSAAHTTRSMREYAVKLASELANSLSPETPPILPGT